MKQATETLRAALKTNATMITLPRPQAALILDQLEGRGLTAQQQMLFDAIQEEGAVSSERIRELIGADTIQAAWIAAWRLGKALERSSLPWQLESVVGVGYRITKKPSSQGK